MGEKKKGTLAEKIGKRKLLLILLGGGVGVLLLLIGSGWLGKSDLQKTAAETAVKIEEEVRLYREETEKQIKELCESVQGVGRVTVAVSLSGGFENVYATESSANGERYVTVGSGSNQQAVLLYRTPPDVTGIGIVCTGGSDLIIRRELLSLLSATYHISTNRIYITEAKNG